MTAWILLIASTLGLLYIFLRRMVLTKKDIIFQEHLAMEEDLAKAESDFENTDVLLGDVPEESLEKPLRKVSSSEVKRIFASGEMALNRKEFDEARECFLAVIDAEDSHLDAHLQLGLLCMKLGDFPNAELYFSKLVNLKKDPVYFSNLGAALYEQQRLLEAAEAYENAIALDNRRANRLQSLAQVYHELGDMENALKFFEMASQRKPKDNGLKIILAEYYRRLGRYDEALVLLNKVLESDPYNDEVKALCKEIESDAAGAPS